MPMVSRPLTPVPDRVASSYGSLLATAKMSSQSSTLRASTPTESRDQEAGKTPVASMPPAVGLKPTTPQKLAGTRTDAPVSVPREPKARRAATAAADPDEDAPVQRERSHGLRASPKNTLVPVVP